MTTSVKADFLVRFAAIFIDGIVVSLISSLVSTTSVNADNGAIISSAPGFLVGALYYVLMWTYYNGQTLGKKVMKIRVVREDGKPVDLQTSILRYLGYIVSGLVLCLGFLWVLFDEKKQGWHDKIAHTFVVKA
jgi:uncharacterized RDD family membrane protein YckC